MDWCICCAKPFGVAGGLSAQTNPTPAGWTPGCGAWFADRLDQTAGLVVNSPWRQANLSTWNIRAALHARDETGSYDVAGFLAGRDKLHATEAAEIGDVRGKRVAHLQCHFGLDTLSLARRGADVTGLDFSPVAIAEARDLAAQAGLRCAFVEADVYEARQHLEGLFDLVYVTWGTICWLPDIHRWGAVVASLLAPGGFLYLADAHPSAMVLDERDGRFEPTFAWCTPKEKPDRFVESQTYTGDALPAATESFNWIHPLSDILGSLIGAGMRLDFLHEHEVLPYKLFPSMIPAGGRFYRLPDGAVPFPLSFSLKAAKV
jgi:SAM-dependent methyltransferase